MNFLSFSLPTLFLFPILYSLLSSFLPHVSLVLFPIFPNFLFLFRSDCFRLWTGSSRLSDPFKIEWDYRVFFGGRPLFHVLSWSWSAVAASLKANGLHSMESICVRYRRKKKKSSYLMKAIDQREILYICYSCFQGAVSTQNPEHSDVCRYDSEI